MIHISNFDSEQEYRSLSKNGHAYFRTNFQCPCRFKCGCNIQFCVKEYDNRFEMWQSGTHNRLSHAESTGILSVHQRSAVIASVKSAPLATGSAVRSNLKNMSPDKHVACDQRSMGAVSRLVKNARRQLITDRMSGIDIDGSEGSMIRFAESISLKTLIEKHNDPNDSFHLDEHQPFCSGYQFRDGVTFLNVSTAHLSNNLARAENCGWQKGYHLDGAYNWCDKSFGIIGIGMNSMGSHFNPVSLNIVNSESKMAIAASHEATITGLLSLYQQVNLCDSDKCGFCTQMREQVDGSKAAHFRKYLKSEDAKRKHFPIDKPCSDHTLAFFNWCKDEFGEEIAVQICANHLGRKIFLWFHYCLLLMY